MLAMLTMSTCTVQAQGIVLDESQVPIKRELMIDENQKPIMTKESATEDFLSENRDPNQVSISESSVSVTKTEKPVYVVEAESLIVREYPDFNYIQVDHVKKGDMLEGIVIEKNGCTWLQLEDNRYVCIKSRRITHITEETVTEEIKSYSYSGVEVEGVSTENDVTLDSYGSADDYAGLFEMESEESDDVIISEELFEEVEPDNELPSENLPEEAVADVGSEQDESDATEELEDDIIEDESVIMKFSADEGLSENDDFVSPDEAFIEDETPNEHTEEFLETETQPEIMTDGIKSEDDVDNVSTEESIEDKEPVNAFSDEDVYLVAQLVYNEAIGEGQAGQMAVAEVVLNRFNSDRFPNTINGVIYQAGQFENNQNIKHRRPSEELVALTDSVLNGDVRIFGNDQVLFFRNAKGSKSDWGRYPHYATVNHHEFYLLQ